MIKNIMLHNWKTHYDSELEFSKGTNVIVGKMGSGKSSIMDAISFALYGTFPALATRKVSLEETIMNRPIKQEQSKVKLDFDYNGKNYEVERILKRKGINEATLREDGTIIAGPKTTEVTKKIEDILEVSYDLFSRAIYSEQNQIDFFLKLSPSQRKEKFDELLGLDKYEKVRTNSVTLKNRMKKNNEDKKTFLEEQKKKMDFGKLKEYENRLSEKEKELNEKEKIKENALKEIKEIEETLKKYEEKEKEYKFLKELEIKTKAKKDSFKEHVQSVKEKLKGKKITEITERLSKLKSENRENAKEIELIEKTIKDNEKLASGFREDLAVQKNILESNKESVENTKDLKADCPICKRPLSEHDKKKLKEELKEEEQEIKEKEKKLENILKEHEKSIQELEKKSESLGEKFEKVGEETQELEKLREISGELEEKEKQTKDLEQELEKLVKIIGENDFDEKKMEKLSNNYFEVKEKNVKIETEIQSGKELMKELEASVKIIRETQQQIQELDKQVNEDDKTIEKLAIFTSALKSTQGELRNMMIETINQAMGEIWQQIYTYGDYLDVKIIVDEGSYEIMVKSRNGEWIRVDGILSGGERSAVAITMRIAISLVLTQNLGWIILDEPTHNLDASSVNVLSEVMRNNLPELIEQIFLITHDKEMENAASGKLYSLEREKEKEGATKILSI